MSTKEMIVSMLDTLTEEQLQGLMMLLKGYEKNDDEYCEQLLQDYINDTSPDKHETVSIEELADELGIDFH